MKKSPYKIVQAVLLCVVGALTLVLLLYLALTPNIEMTRTRDASGYTEITDVAYSEREDEDGLLRQFRFVLGEEIAYDTDLIFRFNHQNADVYLDGERIWSLHASPKLRIIRTPGEQWAMIPLFREDYGKEVLVQLRPVYENYQDQQIRFLIGSKSAVYIKQLLSALPEMLLCLADVFAGCLLFVIAVCLSWKKYASAGLYALASLALSLGLWNFTQTHFASLLLNEKGTLVYYISVTMLALSTFALIKSAKPPRKTQTRRLLEIWAIFYSACVIVQLLLQLSGILDLRQTLTFIHCALAITAVVLIFGSLPEWWSIHAEAGSWQRVNCLWILGVGVLLDLLRYYTRSGSTKLIFVLLSVFAYVLIDGVQIFITYIRQRNELEQTQTQLTMSRVTTMTSQIRSHFVFNVLNAISGMCKYDPEKADETVVRFARYLRSNIDIMEDDRNVPFRQELERLEDYVVLEQIRFGDRICFTTDLQTEDFYIPPLILQPIVENAIKHGISKRKEGGKIHLQTRDMEKAIVITVTDNGIGFPMEALDKQTSVGLRNIRFRLEHLMGGTMDIKSQLGIGTTVTLTLPREG